jgi:hypothetical protein
MVKVLHLPLDCGISNSELADGIVYGEDDAAYEPLLLEEVCTKPTKVAKARAVICGVVLDLRRKRRNRHAPR